MRPEVAGDDDHVDERARWKSTEISKRGEALENHCVPSGVQEHRGAWSCSYCHHQGVTGCVLETILGEK